MRSQQKMKIVVHYPSTPEDREALAQKVAKAHLEAVIRHLSNNVHSPDQRLKLVDMLMNNR